jgi:ubiquinone/menaquinone biosynthesis C-methylase UbiE
MVGATGGRPVFQMLFTVNAADIVMDEIKINKIKRATKGNFNESPVQYQSFEKRHGFFRMLTEVLLSRMELRPGADILDIGCGSGASCVQILATVPDSHVWGLDNSPAMLDLARSGVGESDRLVFVEGDAARLRDHFDFKFDAIIYSASIFLVPDYRESLEQARRLLKEHGSVGLTFMDGPYDSEGNHLFEIAQRSAQKEISLKRAVNWSEFESSFANMFSKCNSWVESFRLPKDVLQEFYSIPAMSAGIFPKIGYPERVKRVAALFDAMPPTEILARWRFMVGRSGE